MIDSGPSSADTHDETGAVVIIGSGAPAASAYEIVSASGDDATRRFAGFLDDAGAAGSYPPAAPVGCIGQVRSLPALGRSTAYVIASWSPAGRRIVASWAASRGRVAAGVAHPSADFSPAAAGPGYLVGAGVQVAAGAVVGEHVQLAADVSVGVATVGSFVTVGAGTTIADGAHIGDEVVLGRGVRIAPGVRVGARAVVHDGVEVTADVADDARVDAPDLVLV